MIREFVKKAAILLLIILPVFTLTFVPDNAFSAEQEETRIFIKDFKVIGNEAIKDERILGAISSYRNNDYTLEELKSIADIVTMLYQEDGYILAKAYIPVQYIKNDIVKVVVVEGELGSLEISYSKYYSQGHVCNFFSRLIGSAVNENQIERAILLANETPSMNVQTVFKKGEMPGTTDMKIDIEDTYPMFFDFEFNNYGNERVSKNRYTANFSMTDPIIGSTLSLKGTIGEQLDDSFYGGIDLLIPLNYEGTKLGMRYINSDYIVGSDLQALGIEGKAEIMGAYLSHSFIHSRNQKLKGTVGFDMKRVFSYAMGAQTSNDDLSVGYLRLDYDNLDRFLGKNYLSLTYSQGFEDLLGSTKLN
ncbi:MAG TPA: ShlB/FhaC/HecB family hemolysin secretion/activation protein, partial [Nitrospirae bacterium]|nr:ShlB/FhaC/HecB family hemolysin secretion/activation protein [Nitrospirota bacterium]HEW81457.1 ShlB/FhaC/HecB family hemolysin secretion/activation protein [Nitrospirota bacterium]